MSASGAIWAPPRHRQCKDLARVICSHLHGCRPRFGFDSEKSAAIRDLEKLEEKKSRMDAAERVRDVTNRIREPRSLMVERHDKCYKTSVRPTVQLSSFRLSLLSSLTHSAAIIIADVPNSIPSCFKYLVDPQNEREERESVEEVALLEKFH